jgi:hypothetical protein
MDQKVENLLTTCSQFDFGTIDISGGQKEFYNELNREIVLLYRSLPESTQTDAVLFLLQHSKRTLDNFFQIAYVPTWSIIYWLMQRAPDDSELADKDIKNAKTGHTMAVFLHYLDDHLADSEIPVTHLALLLRSQSWMLMHQAFGGLADGVSGGEKIVADFINDYYTGVCSSEEIESLDGYCDLFRKQMATGFVVPDLLTRKIFRAEEFAKAILSAFGSFGIAWRLLDDIRDMKEDMHNGTKSAVYYGLPQDMRHYWDLHADEPFDCSNDYGGKILDCLLETGVVDILIERIDRELESAASIADRHALTGLADEFRCLGQPLKSAPLK